MKRILIVGAGKGGAVLLKMFLQTDRMKVVGMIDRQTNLEGIKLAGKYRIPTGTDWKKWVDHGIDIVVEAAGNESILKQLQASFQENTVVISGSIAYIIAELMEEKEDLLHQLETQTDKQRLILNNIRDGMIVVDGQGIIQFINKSTERMMDTSRDVLTGKPVTELIPDSKLPHVLHTRKKEVNQKLQLDNGKLVITTRMPIINEDNIVIGAFAMFKNMTEVRALAEENTNLSEIKTMLEAIIQSSDEAISVVDEYGNGIMINPAYTRITGLTEADVVGKPATVDISEGESMHMQVLQTRRPVRGVRLKVGSARRDVLVNVAPVIVDGKIKGSVGVLHDVSEVKALTSELKRARQIIRNLEAKYSFDDIIGPSSEMKLALEQAKVGARTPALVLLRGESGTGKELFAHAIHNESDRKHNKFIRVNCAAITESILESELFGYEEGAFSGAKRGGKRGLFEEANLGSIFLDEIGELSLNMQAKLLRILQENELVRVGGTDPVAIDVRIITATNLNLEKAIMDKTFREDLYYRLNRLPIHIPSLRERINDLPPLIQHLTEKLNLDYGRKVSSISREAMQSLSVYHWPGNVRELENVIGRAMIYMDMNEDEIQLRHLPDLHATSGYPESAVVAMSGNQTGSSLQKAVDNYEKQFIETVYKRNAFNKTKTAKELDISIRNLYYKMEKHQICKQ